MKKAKTTNRIQENYMKAKAVVNALKASANAIEQAYIREHGIVSLNGTIPSHIWCIEDESVFNEANEAIAPATEALGLYEAGERLHDIEDNLINFGLALAPAKERKVLTDRCFGLNGHYVHVDIREKCVDLALRLDVSTLPKILATR